MGPDLCKSFRRNSDGSWTCVEQTMLTVGAGQTVTIEVDRAIKPGELLGDYDLAAYLEQACAQGNHTDSRA
jgi:hypothetical protein